jgi:hypothetical protein
MGLPFSGLGGGGTGTILGGGGGASLPNATAAGEVPAATGPGTAYTAGPIGLGGLLAARPAASAALLGRTYRASNVGPAGAVYVCVTDGAGAYSWLLTALDLSAAVEGSFAVSDGAGGARVSAADVSALNAATNAAGMRTAIGLGSVNNTADADKPVSSAAQTALNLKAPLASPTFTGTVAGITKAMVGLGSADNTADTAKPVSVAQAAADALVGSAAASDATSKANAAQAAAAADATSKANAAQAAAALYTDGVSAGTEGVAAAYTDGVAVTTLAAAAVDATSRANAAQAAAIAAAAIDATTKANAAVVSATGTAAADATSKANAAAAASLAKSGGTMSGAIAMGSSKVTGLGQATAAGEALAAPVGISNGSLLCWISGTLGALAPGSAYMIPRITAAGSAIEWVAGSTALGTVPSLIPLCDYVVCSGPLTVVGRARFDPGAWNKSSLGYTTVLTLRLLGDVSASFTGTFTLYNVTAETTDATLTATETVPTTKSAVFTTPGSATVYELRAAHNGTPTTDYATVSGAVIEVSWSV